MRVVGIKVLKDQLSAFLRVAAAGETVLVTDRGRVVAELIPPRAQDHDPPVAQRLAELERQGLLVAASVSPRARLPRRKPQVGLAEVLRDLEAGRSDR